MTRDELIARAEAAMSEWYGYHDVKNPWCRGETPDLEFDKADVDDWHLLFELLGRAWGLLPAVTDDRSAEDDGR